MLHLDQQVEDALLPSLDMSTTLSSKGYGLHWTFPRGGNGDREEGHMMKTSACLQPEMGAVPRAGHIWRSWRRMLRKGPSSQNVQATKAPGKPIPGQLGFLQEPGLIPVGCDIHTNFSPALQGSHSQGSKGQ